MGRRSVADLAEFWSWGCPGSCCGVGLITTHIETQVMSDNHESRRKLARQHNFLLPITDVNQALIPCEVEEKIRELRLIIP